MLESEVIQLLLPGLILVPLLLALDGIFAVLNLMIGWIRDNIRL
jgi:hypothetical protein